MAADVVRVDEKDVYVAAQALVSSGANVLLAGFPNYVWPSGDDERMLPRVDSIFGVVVGANGNTKTVPLPRLGYFSDPRAVPRPEGGWHVVFAERAQSIHDDPTAPIVSLWSGVLSGGAWSQLQRLPSPKDYDFAYAEGASLARTDSVVVLAVVTEHVGQVVVFESKVGERDWTHHGIALAGEQGERTSVVGASYISVVPWNTGYAVLVLRNDVRTDTIYQSLFHYIRMSSDWQQDTVVVGLAPHVTKGFAVTRSPSIDVVSWVSDGIVTGYVGNLRSGGWRHISIDRASPTTSALRRIVSASLELNERLFWITQGILHDESASLRLFTTSGYQSQLIDSIGYGTSRLQAATIDQGSIVLAVARFKSARPTPPESIFVSALLRLQVDCVD